MAGALNVFKTITANLTTSMDTVYTCPLGYNAVVLMAQISNIDTANTIQISANVARTTGNTALIKNAKVPVGDAITVVTGRLVLETDDGFASSASANNVSQLTLSVLESLVG
jgi:hypothetical protein